MTPANSTGSVAPAMQTSVQVRVDKATPDAGTSVTPGDNPESLAKAPRVRQEPSAENHRRAVKQLSLRDCRIDSLKVLALTLMRELESLEIDSTNESAADLNLQAEVDRFEAELIRSALIRTGGVQRQAARLLHVKVTTLNTKIRRYEIKIGDSGSQRSRIPATPADESVND